MATDTNVRSSFSPSLISRRVTDSNVSPSTPIPTSPIHQRVKGIPAGITRAQSDRTPTKAHHHPAVQLFQSMLEENLTNATANSPAVEPLRRAEKPSPISHQKKSVSAEDEGGISVVMRDADDPPPTGFDAYTGPKRRGKEHAIGLKAMMKANRKKKKQMRSKNPAAEELDIELTLHTGMDLRELIDGVQMEPVERFYSIKHELGKGNFGTVYLAFKRHSGFETSEEAIAIKKIQKLSSANVGSIAREVKVMQALQGHDGLVQLLGVHEDHASIYLLLELVPGGDLCAAVANRETYTEGHARYIFFQLVSALEFMHERRVVHLDLKPENIMCVNAHNPVGDMVVKVTDFGVSKLLDQGEKLINLLGTPLFSAPEVHREEPYSFEADIWSLGAILYVLLVGYGPYDFMERSLLPEMMREGIMSFEEPIWSELSHSAVDMVRSLCHPSAACRPHTLQTCLTHPWLCVFNSPFAIKLREQQQQQQQQQHSNLSMPPPVTVVDASSSIDSYSSPLSRFPTDPDFPRLGDTVQNMAQFVRRQALLKDIVKDALKMSAKQGYRIPRTRRPPRELQSSGKLQNASVLGGVLEEPMASDTKDNDDDACFPHALLSPMSVTGSESATENSSEDGSGHIKSFQRHAGSFHISLSDGDDDPSDEYGHRMSVVLRTSEDGVTLSQVDPNLAKLSVEPDKSKTDSKRSFFDFDGAPKMSIEEEDDALRCWHVAQHFSVREAGSLVRSASPVTGRSDHQSLPYYVHADDLTHISKQPDT